MTEEFKAFFVQTIKDCAVKVHGNDDDIAAALNYIPPETRTQKCLFTCFFETVGVVSKFSAF